MNKGVVLLTVLLTLSLSAIFIHKGMVPVGVASTKASIYVDPPISAEAVGQNFMININISDVVDLYGWEFKLGWNSTILDAVDVTEGSFLKEGGETYFPPPEINNTAGYILAYCTLQGDVPGVSGNGTLAMVEFYVEAQGECLLDLYDTKLVDSFELQIDHTAIDGYYYTPIHDVAVIDLVASEVSVDVTVENQGTETETFDVSTYYTLLTDPLIGTQTTTLEGGDNTTLNFPWSPSPGRYQIRAEASQVPDETDTADNTYTIIKQIGSGGSNSGNESNNGYYILTLLSALFAAVTIIPELLNKRSNLDNSATVSKQNLQTKARENIWHDWVLRRQPI